jgi:hypothetical protein
MSKKRKKAKPPFLMEEDVKAPRPKITGQLQSWFGEYPMLRTAYREAIRRFQDLPGVCGIGVGRKFKEALGKYGAAPESTGGYCIKVFVERKRKDVAKKLRIPGWINVDVADSGRRTRVLLDVVSMGRKNFEGPLTAKIQDGRGWPEAGKIAPGRLYAFGRKSASDTPSEFLESDVKLGTTGALIHYQDENLYGISAGHVFTDPCSSNFEHPKGRRALGAKGRIWQEVEGSDFYPPTIRTDGRIRDVMLFPIPLELRPSPNEICWPDGFTRELATQKDIDRAVISESATGFIWVDRKGHRPEPIPVNLEAAIPLLRIPVRCSAGVTKKIVYAMAWPMRFSERTSTTLRGDSGAPVFLWTEDNARCRLLGIHFLEIENRHAYAMDARSFFREVLRSYPNKDVWFA